MASDPFRPVAPEDDSLVQIDDGETDWQALQNAAADLEIVEYGHEWPRGKIRLTIALSAKFSGTSSNG